MPGAINAGIHVADAAIQTAQQRAERSIGNLAFNMEPVFGVESFRIAQPTVVSVDPVLDSGTHCYSCAVNWRSAKPTVAKWTDFHEVGTRRFATLEPMAQGSVTLTVEICPGGPFDCQRQAIRATVIR
jgi:hypothetical protein